MKTATKLAILLAMVAPGTIALSAKTPEQTYLESYREDSSKPTPVAVVSPSVGSGYAGSTVELEFVVDANGVPKAFSVLSAADRMLADAVVYAVRQWRFAPAYRNGVPVETRVSLPVKIVDERAGAGQVAMK